MTSLKEQEHDSTHCLMGGPPHLGPCVVNTFCQIHGVHEPDQPGDYRVCDECCHVYRTEEDFLAACDEIGHPVGDASEAYSCPLCF